MGLQLRILLLMDLALVHMVHLSGQQNNATMTRAVHGFTIGVAMIKTGDFAQRGILVTTKEKVVVRKKSPSKKVTL
jgi:hypothetical protein